MIVVAGEFRDFLLGKYPLEIDTILVVMILLVTVMVLLFVVVFYC